MLPRPRYSRRKFLATTAALTMGGSLSASRHTPTTGTDRAGRLPLAVLGSVYRPLSYLYHLAGRFLHGYPRNGKLHLPSGYISSLWVEQSPENDLSREICRQFDVRLVRTVKEALVDADGRLSVDGVLLVFEHGNYSRNEYGQILYPRFEVFKQVVDVFRETGRSVPVFVAKHLSYEFAKAKQMMEWSQELSFPLLAGSTLPTTIRRPELEIVLDSDVRDSLVAAYGPPEIFGFDALEALQCMVERRCGGESGIAAMTCLSGNDVWRAAEEGRWSRSLLDAALARSESANLGDVRSNVGNIALPGMPAMPPIAFLIEYRDGTRGTVLLLNGHIQDFVFAARIQSEAELSSCLFHTPPAPGARQFDGQASAIEQLVATGHSPQPIERTLMTTGMMSALMRSHAHRGERIETPELAFHYNLVY